MEILLILVLIALAILVAVGAIKNKEKKKEQGKLQKIIDHNRAAQLKHVDIAGNPNEKSSQVVEIAGVHIGNRQASCVLCKKGDELMLVPEDDNSYDKNAIKIMTFSGYDLGYIPAYLAAEITPKIESGIVYRAFYSYNEYSGSLYRFYAYIDLKEYQPLKENPLT